ncbi:prisilkin-39 [Drosophila subobscura]|uniref:prisilkin-39 n=1 Tax=Drosophila subobscura TaxID=7241 RepID=UPI00155B2068|nr:prisilkin-39 [Drosophila subobscura]
MSAKNTRSCLLWLGLLLSATFLQMVQCQYYGYPYYGGTGAGAGAGAGGGYGNGYGNAYGYGYPSYGGYPYYSYPSYNPYSIYGQYGQYGQSQFGYPSYGGYPYGGGNGMNTAYASSSGGFASASAGSGGYYG